MSYSEEYILLAEKFNQEQESIILKSEKLKIYNLPFESFDYNILPGEDSYRCNYHNITFKSNPDVESSLKFENELLNVADSKIQENIHFKYSVFKNLKSSKSKKVIILFHGLNEKSWEKYLVWAKKLLELTGKSVVLFPLAFHMNRAPKIWSDPRLMKKICKERLKFFPNIVSASFANTAMSTRLQSHPQRFLWSGMQSYYDVIQLVTEIKDGNHPLIHQDASIDFFAYSIGAFLSQILIMTNPTNFFKDTKLFIFCGGPLLKKMSAVSKYILDSEANIALYSYFIEHLDKEMKRDERLTHYFSKLHPAGKYFRCMLDYHKMKKFREKRLKKLCKQIEVVTLKKDKVIPHYEVVNSLKGEDGKIPIKIRKIDFPYEYNHVIPFPISDKFQKEVNRSFEKVFRYAAKFLK
ncbi:MAG: hypothetical protein HQ534_13485 [Armatimonadetes bacterium]|nr:hypothetical protein [Armatimonadota bacterium]